MAGTDTHHSRTTFVAYPKRCDQNVAEYETRHNNRQPEYSFFAAEKRRGRQFKFHTKSTEFLDSTTTSLGTSILYDENSHSVASKDIYPVKWRGSLENQKSAPSSS